MEQYLLKDKTNRYWIWYREDKDKKHFLTGPHPEPLINYPFTKVKDPKTFKPEDYPGIKSQVFC